MLDNNYNTGSTNHYEVLDSVMLVKTVIILLLMVFVLIVFI